jgi:hypothetical protein
MSSVVWAHQWLRLWHMPSQRKRLLCLALFLLFWDTLCVRWLSFRPIAVFLGEQGYAAQHSLTPDQQVWCRDWAWALAAVANRLPWTAICLVRALAGQCDLRNRRVGATVYLGVAAARTSAGGLIDAHAWLCCGEQVLTGGYEAARFKPLVIFGTHWP